MCAVIEACHHRHHLDRQPMFSLIAYPSLSHPVSPMMPNFLSLLKLKDLDFLVIPEIGLPTGILNLGFWLYLLARVRFHSQAWSIFHHSDGSNHYSQLVSQLGSHSKYSWEKLKSDSMLDFREIHSHEFCGHMLFLNQFNLTSFTCLVKWAFAQISSPSVCQHSQWLWYALFGTLSRHLNPGFDGRLYQGA